MPLWFRAYNEAIDDRKFKHIANKLGVPKVQVLGVWWVLLALANNSTDRGRLLVDETTILTRRDIMAEVSEGMTETQAFALFNEFVIRELLAIDEETGAYYVTQFNRRNFVSDDSTKRVRRHRNKKKGEEAISGNSDVTPDETLQQPTESESESESKSKSEQQKTESQQQTAEVDAVAGHELLLKFDIGEPSATKYADQPLAHIEGWIMDAKAKGKKLTNPQGYVVGQLRAGIPPPPAEPEWQRFVEGEHPEYVGGEA